jgi:DNA-binding response OmpR family regulator
LLPRVDSAPVADAAATNARKSTGGIRGGTETIMLVEDEPSVLELAQRTLQHLGYNVLPCGGPDEALRTFGEYQNRVQLLVTDVVMPRMNGKDLAARITAREPSVAVLFTSGYGENIIAKQGIIDDGIHFIGKPYRPEDLARRVRSLLDAQAALPR